LETRQTNSGASARLSEHEAAGWITPVLLTTATEGQGVGELKGEVDSHLRFLRESGEWSARERARLKASLDGLLHETLVARWRAEISEADYQSVLDRVVSRSLSPREAVAALIGGNGTR
jgi:LAO/AO transport system kinase